MTPTGETIFALNIDANRKRRQKGAEGTPGLARRPALRIEHQSLHADIGFAAKRDLNCLSRGVKARLAALSARLSSPALEAQHTYRGSVLVRHARKQPLERDVHENCNADRDAALPSRFGISCFCGSPRARATT